MSPKKTTRSGSSKSEHKSGTKSSSKAAKGSSSEKQQQPAIDSEWSEWEYNAKLNCESRYRKSEDGNWEYQDRDHDQDVPRSMVRSDILGNRSDNLASTEGPDSSTGADSIYGLSSISTASPSFTPYPRITNLGPTSNTGVITYGVNAMRISYGTTNQGASMVDHSGNPIPRESSVYSHQKDYDEDDEEDDEDFDDTDTVKQNSMRSSFSYAIPSTNAKTTSSGTYSQASYQNRGEQPVLNLPNQIRSGSTESVLQITAPQTQPLHPDYKIHDAREFRFGRVFKILWSEPMGHAYDGKTKGTEKTQVKFNEDYHASDGKTKGAEKVRVKFNEDCYASIRRFIIYDQKEGHCLCVPILTYGGKATTKNGVKPQDHAIVYTEDDSKDKKKNKKKNNQSKVVAAGKPEEIPGEQKLNNRAIRISPKTPRDRLDGLSRLNYAKIYTVEYNVKVCFIGQVHEKSVKYFSRDFNAIHTPLPEDVNAEFSDEGGQ